jgi:hypothetical protein
MAAVAAISAASHIGSRGILCRYCGHSDGRRSDVVRERGRKYLLWIVLFDSDPLDLSVHLGSASVRIEHLAILGEAVRRLGGYV